MVELIINKFGDKGWRQNKEYHRIGRPAITWLVGYEYWYQYGKLHRLNGPAKKTPLNSNDTWYYQGLLIDCNTQEEFERIIKLRLLW
jgi:hypothetical protein